MAKYQSFEEILDDDESILWRGKPELLPFIFNVGSLTVSIFGLFFTLFSCTFMGVSIVTILGAFMSIFAVPFLFLGIVLVLNPLLRYLSYKHTEYAITDRRIITKGGIFAVNYKVVDYDQVENMQVSVTLGDQLFNKGTGTVMIDTGETRSTNNGVSTIYTNFSAIKDPYEVFKQLKDTGMDIKTDMEYPNKLRPSENPGYQTKYKKPAKKES